uniref:ZAD domain-containing protein n=1 Tax=Anopheles arabiensis TaxID=7173 RepID=A0A182HY54_ANOAR
MNNDCVDLRLNFENLCRFCLSLEDCVPLFINSTINEILIDAADVLLPKVDENDGLPNCVCARCHHRMADFSKFEATALEVYNKLQSVIAYLDEVEDDYNPGSQPMLEDDANDQLETSPNAIEDVPAQEFYTSSQWKQHQSLAHRERTFRCDVCGQAFLLKHHLTEHAQLHTDGSPHECDVCGKAFKRERYLHVHKRRRHTMKEEGE